nr:hypothetical protein [Pandoravirus massiliensis]
MPCHSFCPFLSQRQSSFFALIPFSALLLSVVVMSKNEKKSSISCRSLFSPCRWTSHRARQHAHDNENREPCLFLTPANEAIFWLRSRRLSGPLFFSAHVTATPARVALYDDQAQKKDRPTKRPENQKCKRHSGDVKKRGRKSARDIRKEGPPLFPVVPMARHVKKEKKYTTICGDKKTGRPFATTAAQFCVLFCLSFCLENVDGPVGQRQR